MNNITELLWDRRHFPFLYLKEIFSATNCCLMKFGIKLVFFWTSCSWIPSSLKDSHSFTRRHCSFLLGVQTKHKSGKTLHPQPQSRPATETKPVQTKCSVLFIKKGFQGNCRFWVVSKNFLGVLAFGDQIVIVLWYSTIPNHWHVW